MRYVDPRAGRRRCIGAIALVLTGCARPTPAPHGRAVAAPSDPEFLAPPALVAADRDAQGATRLIGHAEAGARVDLASPDGVRRSAVADAHGRWSLVAPAADRPRLFALSAMVGARLLRASGALVTAPAPCAPAYLARSGAASLPVWGPASVRIVALDWDAGGGAGVAGLAAAATRVELLIDGSPSGGGRSDAQGRFSLLAVRAPLRPGAHVVSVRTTGGTATMAALIAPAAPLRGAPVRTERVPEGWRIDWAPPGGGVQTTLAVAQSGAPA